MKLCVSGVLQQDNEQNGFRTMIVLSEAYQHMMSASAQELARADDAARAAGCQVCPIPADFTFFASAPQALMEVPQCSSATPGAWIGFIPGLERYTSVYEAALTKN